MSDPRSRILIVDDEPDLLAMLRFGLELDGFEVLEASDGEQGLDLARTQSPSLIVLDLMLPRVDGYKVCRALKFDARYRDIPIFILSARTAAKDRQLALDLGADEFMTKPYEVKALVAKIRERLALPPRAAA